MTGSAEDAVLCRGSEFFRKTPFAIAGKELNRSAEDAVLCRGSGFFRKTPFVATRKGLNRSAEDAVLCRGSGPAHLGDATAVSRKISFTFFAAAGGQSKSVERDI